MVITNNNNNEEDNNDGDDYITYNTRHIKSGDDKILKPAIDMTYSDMDEGMRRARLTINILCMHISNIAQQRWEQMMEANPDYYKQVDDKFLAYEITSLMFTIYNELLAEIPSEMQDQINKFVINAIFNKTNT